MLEILGTIGGNILSLPGILGLALGMMTRNAILACLMGGTIGLIEVFLFGGLSFVGSGGLEIVVSVFVGILSGSLGCYIRRKGAAV